MMKRLCTLLILVLAATVATAQEYQKGTGLSYYDTKPTAAPSLKRGSEWAYAIEEKKLYRYDRDSLAWVAFSGGGVPADLSELAARIQLVEDSISLHQAGLDSLRERITIQELRQDTFTYLIQDSILVTKRGDDIFRLDTIRVATGGPGSADNQELSFIPETGRLLIVRGNEVDLSVLRYDDNGIQYRIDSASLANRSQDVRIDSLAAVSAGEIPFDGSRTVRRGFQAGQITNATTVVEQLEFLYYAPPTLSLSSSPNNTLVQVGTVNTFTLTSTTSNPGGATLSNGRFERGGVSVESFGSATSATHSFTFAPGAPSGNNALSYTYRCKQDYTPEDGTAQSNARTYSSAYPILYGQSATDYRSAANGGTGQNPYPAMQDPLVVTESTRTVTFNGTGVYLYYLVPSTWNDTTISQIVDPNGFPVNIDEWNITTVQVTTTDTENTIVLDYIMLSTIETKNPDNAAYTFIF